MIRTPVSSSSIRSVGHDPAAGTLDVEFKNGKVYRYVGVGADAHAALITAKSVGWHFASHIKGKFEAQPLKDGGHP